MLIQRRSIAYIAIALTALLLITGCGGIRMLIRPYKNKPLVWQPTNSIQDLDLSKTAPLYKEQIKVLPFVDLRENKHDIAFRVTTKDDVAAWSTDRFEYILKQVGLNIVEAGETVAIKGEIFAFEVVEERRYQGNIRIKLTVESSERKTLWQGMLIGRSSRFGGTYKLDNYYKTISDAYLDVVKNLLKNESFISTIVNKNQPTDALKR